MPLQQQVFEVHPGPLAANRAGTRVKHRVVSMFSGCGGMDLGFQGGFGMIPKVYPNMRPRRPGRSLKKSER